MNRLLVIYNSHSSRYENVKKEVLVKLKDLPGYLVGKFEIEGIGVEKNVEKLVKILKDKDIVLAAGGDATAVIAANAIMMSGKDVTLAVLPYGNFNDLARTLGTKDFSDLGLLRATKKINKLYPLEIRVDGKLFRYATCYVTIGMTAEAVKLFDTPKVRKVLKTRVGRAIGSYIKLAKWYFKNRHRKTFIPKFKLNGVLQHPKTSDYAAVNGRSMARIMKGGEDFRQPKIFRSETDRLASFWRLFKLMTKSIFVRVPGTETTSDRLDFLELATVEIQAEGESRVFESIKKIEIRKAAKCLKVIEH